MNDVSYKVMKTEEFPGLIFYRASCSCGNVDCDMTLEFERDKETCDDMVFLNLYKSLRWCSSWVSPDTWWNRVKRRIFGTFELLLTGSIKMEESFIFQGENHILEFIAALNEGLEKIKRKEK